MHGHEVDFGDKAVAFGHFLGGSASRGGAVLAPLRAYKGWNGAFKARLITTPLSCASVIKASSIYCGIATTRRSFAPLGRVTN